MKAGKNAEWAYRQKLASFPARIHTHPMASLVRLWATQRFAVVGFLLCALVLSGSAAPVDFDHEIVPILRQHCADCHTGTKKKGGLSFNTRESLMKGGENGAVVKPGNGGGSRLLEVVLSKDTDEQMPPKGDRLTPLEVSRLKAWIDEGATWTTGFSFQAPSYEPPLHPRHPVLPEAHDGRQHPLDRLVDAELAAHGIPRPAPLDDGTFLRRVSLDLVGLLPDSADWQKFLADSAPDKRARFVHQLMTNDVAYAEHWLSFWNDLLRNDYSGTGYIDGGRKQITPWLYQALLENKPYDQFARELIAPTSASEGFARGIQWRGAVSAGQTVPIQFAQSVGQTFLGINLKCASCHDSFIDRWTLDDAYGLAAIYSDKPLQLYRCDKATARDAKASWLFPELGQVDPAAPPADRLKRLAELMTNPENGRFSRTIVNRLWHRLMGHGIVHPVDAMQTAPWSPDLLDFLASDFVDHGYDIKHTLELICTSAAYQSRSESVHPGQDDHGFHFAGPRSKRMTSEQFVDAVWQLTGTAPTSFDAPVVRGRIDPNLKSTGRWIWAVTNPAPAGQVVTFRREWVLTSVPALAGAALTADNRFTLYVNGQKLREDDNWETVKSVELEKLLHAGTNRLVITAANGGDSPNPAGLLFEVRWKDEQDRWQSMGSDARWQWTVGGADERGSIATNAEWLPALEISDATWKEHIHGEMRGALTHLMQRNTPMVRASLVNCDLLQRALGRPNREQIVSTRPNDLSTLEAMDLSNGSMLASRLQAGAKRLVARWRNTDDLVQWLYPAALSRAPTTIEVAAAREFVGLQPTETGVEDLLWSVCMLPEFQLIR